MFDVQPRDVIKVIVDAADCPKMSGLTHSFERREGGHNREGQYLSSLPLSRPPNVGWDKAISPPCTRTHNKVLQVQLVVPDPERGV